MSNPYSTSRQTAQASRFTRFFSNLERGFALPTGRRERLIRPRHPRVVAGVCSGLAVYFGWDLTILRVVVAVLCVASSDLLLLAYAAAWVLIPEGAYALPARSGAPGIGASGS